MNDHNSRIKKFVDRPHFLIPAILVCIACAWTNVAAQEPDAAKMRADAVKLMSEVKYTEAFPLLEKLALITPDDPEIQLDLGFALIAVSKNSSDPANAKKLRARARTAFVKAKESGDTSPLVSAMIDSMAPDGGENPTFSNQAAVDDLMQKAEASFSTGKLDEALSLYQQALKLDPKLYYAALFSGDVYLRKEMYADAEAWFQRAIKVDPTIETAYRYSATPLMNQKKYDQARDRYIEAWITEPYNKFAVQGILQWGETTGTSLAHPKVDIPEITMGDDGKSRSTLNIDPSADDGSMAWMTYVSTREAWRKDLFFKSYPDEKQYRHSLKEEAAALRAVVAFAKETKPKSLNPQIATLSRLDQDGVLEAFILMAHPDRDIAAEHPAYLKASRDKLRQYVAKYVVGNK